MKSSVSSVNAPRFGLTSFDVELSGLNQISLSIGKVYLPFCMFDPENNLCRTRRSRSRRRRHNECRQDSPYHSDMDRCTCRRGRVDSYSKSPTSSHRPSNRSYPF